MKADVVEQLQALIDTMSSVKSMVSEGDVSALEGVPGSYMIVTREGSKWLLQTGDRLREQRVPDGQLLRVETTGSLRQGIGLQDHRRAAASDPQLELLYPRSVSIRRERPSR